MSSEPTRAGGSLIVVSAPSGAGKTSLVAAAIAGDARLAVAVSHTTRPRRSGEVDGRDYCFVTDTEFRTLLAADAFVESAEIFGHRYGTSRIAVARQLRLGADLILEIDWQGARQVRARMPCISVFILPPSRRALEERLHGRGQDAPHVIAGRLAKAIEEMSHHAEFDYVIVNDEFDAAVAEFRSIVAAARQRTSVQRLQTAAQRLRHAALIVGLLSP